MRNPKPFIYCAFSLLLGIAIGLRFASSPTNKLQEGHGHSNQQPEWKNHRLTIASITQSKPHNEIRSKDESEFILQQATSSSMSPGEFSDFLLAIDNIKLRHTKESLNSLITFRDFAKARFNGSKGRDRAEFFDHQLSQSGEVFVIHTQLLEREISAIRAWKPGLTAEKCLAQADSQTHQ